MGLKVYTSLEEYGKPIDMSVIVVPTAAVREAVVSSLRRDAKYVVVITAGFKEVDEAGARLETEIADLCRGHGARLLGPNSLGLINTHHKLNAAFASHMPDAGGISVLSQSGALCSAILDWAASRKVGIATLLSMGNKADLCETDFLAAFRNDEKTKVVAGYLESITCGDEFIRVAESVASIKPVVILKSGTTSAGSKAASSHTGALAGADVAYEAAFRRAGIIRADTFESLFDFATAFAMQPLPHGNRVAIITNAGGPGTMAADAVERGGMRMASIDPDIAQGLRSKLPRAARTGNPIDLLEDAPPERYALAVEAAQSDPGVDAVIAILTPQAVTEAAETARAIAASLRGKKPVLPSSWAEETSHRPPGTGGRQHAQLSVARTCGGSPQSDAGVHSVASAAAPGGYPLSCQPAPGAPHHPHQPGGEDHLGEVRAKDILKATTSWCRAEW
jgi:acetyltransferase